jgi:hypothetical protein
MAFQEGVFAAHDAFERGQFDDHAGGLVGFG